jgi:hypothetical protein
MQKELFYPKIMLDYPYKQTTAVLKRKVKAEDGLTYAAKGKISNNDYTALNEWVCANIAKKVGIPVPDFKILIDFDDSLLFGSRWETAINPLALVYNTCPLESPEILSSIFIFDLLMLNTDRHLSNLFVQNVEGIYKLLAFDHSHALLFHNPLPNPDQILNPRMDGIPFFWNIMNLKIDYEEVNRILDNFSKINHDFYKEILSPCNVWATTEIINMISEWLKSRLNSKQGILDFIGGLK